LSLRVVWPAGVHLSIADAKYQYLHGHAETASLPPTAVQIVVRHCQPYLRLKRG